MSYAPPPDLDAKLSELSVTLTPDQVQQLTRFVQLLLEANTRFNLTTMREPEEAWSRHVLDSLSLAPHLQLKNGGTVVDVGAGGGLPGLPLAIACPQLRFTLIDATGKKVRYIDETAQALGLKNVSAVHGRAEELSAVGAPMRERFDLGVARAVAPLAILLEFVTPFLRPGARLLAIKGQRAAEELSEAKEAMKVLQVESLGQARTPTGTIVELRKTGPTPKRYPRRSGEPKRAPLGGPVKSKR